MWNVKTNWKECIVSRCSVVVGCVTLHRTSETNLLVGVNFSPSLSLSLSLSLSVSLFLYTYIYLSVYPISFSVSSTDTHARSCSYSPLLFRTLVLFRACARVTAFAIVITNLRKPTFLFKRYAATMTLNIGRSSCVHAIALESTPKSFSRVAELDQVDFFKCLPVTRHCDLLEEKE